MAKDLEIKVTVDSSQLDVTRQKVETTKQVFANSPISIRYDIDGKPVDIAIDKSLNLQKQVRELTKALRSVREGSDEFKILSSSLNDAQDKLAASNAKSRDLLGSLQLIPGPIGQIASQLNGAISALKLFSGFSMKDIAFQFKELNNDLNDIVKNLFGVGGAANKAKAELADTGATGLNTAAEVKNTEVTVKNADAQLESAGAKDIDVVATKKDTVATLENTLAQTEAAIVEQKKLISINRNTIARENALIANRANMDMTVMNTAVESREVAMTQLQTLEQEKGILVQKIATEQTKLGTAAVVKDTKVKEVATGVTNGFTAAIKAFATSTLGIVAIIGAATYALYKYIDGKVKLNQAEKDGLEVQKKAVDVGQENISLLNSLIVTVKRSDVTQREKNKAVNDYNEKLGDTLGKVKSYDELTNKLVLNGPAYISYLQVKSKAEAAYALSVETTKKALQKGAEDPVENLSIFAKLIGFEFGLADSTMKKIGANVRDANASEIQKTADNYFTLFQGFQKEAVDAANKLKLPVPEIKTDGKTETVKPKELQDKELIQKEKELSLALIQEQKERDIAQLLLAKEKEKNEIEALNISPKNKSIQVAALLTLENKFQIEKQAIIDKYDEEQKKKDEEAAKAKKSVLDALKEYNINSIKDEVVKSKVERIKQYQEEVEKLDEFLKKKEITQIQYDATLINLRKAFANDIAKIDSEAKIKELEQTKTIDESRLRIFQMNMDQSNATRIGYLGQFFAQQLKVEDDNYKIQQERYKGNLKALEAADIEHSNNVAAIKEAERRQKFDIYKKGTDDLVNVFAAESDLQKSAIILKQVLLGIELGMEISKTIAFSKLSLARSKVAVAEGTAQTAKIGFPQNVIPLALYAIQAALIISTIIKASGELGKAKAAPAGPPPMGANYGKGGIIEGPLHTSAAGGTPIMAEGGEAVMTRGAVTAFRPLLSALNQMGGGTAFSGGVMGQSPFDNPDTAGKSMEPQIIKTYIVERDLTSTQERQARLKSLSTL